MVDTGFCGLAGLIGFEGFTGLGGLTGLDFSGASSRIGDEIVGRSPSPQSGLNISLGFGADMSS
jgi:hypothetical protein